MKLFRLFSVTIASLGLLTGSMTASTADPGQISITVGRLLEQNHYNQQKLNKEIGSELLDNYLEALDHSRLYFTQQDIDAIKLKHGASLDDDILLGNPSAAVEIFNLYRRRIEERVAKVMELIEKGKFDFKSKRTITINRQKVPWPKDEKEADQLWRDRIENEFLQEKLAKHALDTPKNVLTRRYKQVLKNLAEQSDTDAVDLFLSTLAQTYDPHSEYLNKSDMENFSISMKLSLVGIGAQLQSDEGYAKVTDLITGGPALKDGRLKIGDRISAVAQGNTDFTDTVDMKLDKVVRLIRGKKGTTVRLQVIPAHSTDPSARKIVELVRDEVKLKDQEAKAEIIEQKDEKGHPIRLGWITLPSFYSDMQDRTKSTTADVARLLARLKKENINGLVVDLRRNGGGSLDEVVNLTGLFIKGGGPVVQVKGASGPPRVLRTRGSSDVYEGPMIVLTTTLSASASEIFAGALQDYGRALIVGDRHTFGKGTVQTILDISRFIPFLGGNNNEAGALKLTIQKFYRIAGGSTQLKGVESDIVLPSIYDYDEIGEKALKKPLPYDEVPPESYRKVTDQPLFINELRERSQARVKKEPEFRYITENLKRLKEKIAKNSLSLNEKERRAEIERDKARIAARKADRAKRKLDPLVAYSITLDNVDKPQLELVKNDDAEQKAKHAPKPKTKKNAKGDDSSDEDELDEEEGFKEPKIDPVKLEALQILTDLIERSKASKTASVTP